MDVFQNILTYLALAIAVGYIAYRYFLPKKFFSSKKTKKNSCGETGCGCS